MSNRMRVNGNESACGIGRVVALVLLAAFAGAGTARAQPPNVIAFGSNQNADTSVPTSLSDAKAVAGGYNHSLALKSDGTVVVWGERSTTNVPAGVTGVVAIAAGWYHSLALKSDGTVVGWGSNYFGESTAPTGLTGVVALAGGNQSSLALKSDGTVVAWGKYASYANGPPGLTGVVAIAAGDYHSLALKSDGTVVSWGLNRYGENDVPAGLTGVVAIAAGLHHNLALKSDGTVVGWGENRSGEGVAPAGLTGVVRISTGWVHSVALKSDGTVVAWGDNASGIIDVPVGLAGVVEISAGAFHTLALKGDSRTPRAWGDNSYGQSTIPAGLTGVDAIAAGDVLSLALKSDGTVAAWGYNGQGQTAIPAGLSDVVAIAAGDLHSLALKSDGTLAAWGANANGQTTIPAGLSGVVAIAAGGQHNVALKSDGTLIAWGLNNFGQTMIPAGLSGVVAIAAGYFHNLALKSDGTLIAWGDNTYGRSTIPAGLTGVVAIAAGYKHNLALKSDGTLVGWGNNDQGQTTIPAGLSGVVAIAAGFYHSLALKSDGTLAAWGDNTNGQTTIPTGLSGVVAIAAGFFHSLAITVKSTTAVTIASSPTGLNFSVSGTGCQAGASYTSPITMQWTPGSSCTVTFTATQSGAAGTQSVFTGWADGGVIDNPRTLSVPATATTYTANFKTQYLLTTAINPTGTGSVSGGGYYDSGTAASVMASANNGYAFQNWTGDPVASSTSASTTVTMSAPRTVTANFIPLTPVSVGTSPTGLSFSLDGNTYSAPQTVFWVPGSSHTVATTSAQMGLSTRYLWLNWSDGGPISHPVNAPVTATAYTANFKTQYTLTTQVSPGSAAGSIAPITGFVDAGAVVPVSATPSAGYAFTGFSGALSGTTNPQNLTMNAPATVTANFIALPDLTIVKTHAGGRFSQGQIGASYTLTVNNIGIGPSFGTVMVTDTLPTGLTLVSMAGSGWTCGAPNANNVCTRTLTDSVGSGGSFAPITVTVNVDPAAPGSVINTATVAGGGEVNLANDLATDPTMINPVANVTGQMSVTNTGFGRNRATGLWSTTMTVTNTGAVAINGPIQVVLTNLSSNATMTNNTGMRNGWPYVTVSAGPLAFGASVSVPIQFANPTNGFINFTPVSDSGVF